MTQITFFSVRSASSKKRSFPPRCYQCSALRNRPGFFFYMYLAFTQNGQGGKKKRRWEEPVSRQVWDGYPQQLLPPRPSIRRAVRTSLTPAPCTPVQQGEERKKWTCAWGVGVGGGGCVGGWVLTLRSHMGNSSRVFSTRTARQWEKMLCLSLDLVLSLVLKLKAFALTHHSVL